MHVICVDFEIKPTRLAEFMPLMRKQARTSLDSEPGCSRFDVCIDPSIPARVFLYELYDSAAAFDAHLASAHFQAFDKAVADMVDKKTVRVLHLA